MKIAPDLVASLARGRTIILVSGTNGKTTTTSMCVAGWGGEVTTNQTGANMPAGHVAALVESSKSASCSRSTRRGSPTRGARRPGPRVVVLLNLSRDQLDRANEVRHSPSGGARRSSPENAELMVVANANDPLVVYAAEVDAANVRWCDVPTSWSGDALSCPVHARHQSRRFQPRGTAPAASPSRSTLTTRARGRVDSSSTASPVRSELSMPGEFNRSNAAMALTALHSVGVAI
jgi:lipid II isoglutaminyl synthase (glutamine-hydrolysing)